MVSVGVFITTHILSGARGHYRHGPGFGDKLIKRFRDQLIRRYRHYDPGPGIDPCDVWIMDTHSDHPDFDAMMEDVLDLVPSSNVNLQYKLIPNVGGVFASIKQVMNDVPANPTIAPVGPNHSPLPSYDYYLFHTDDSVLIGDDNWASEIVDEYDSLPRFGIIGRGIEALKLGPNGLVDHRGVAPHIAKIWGIKEDKLIDTLHADWYFTSSFTIEALADNWYDPICCEESMKYQKILENYDYTKLANLGDNRQSLDNFHIGREIDMLLRLDRIGHTAVAYKGNKILFQK
jgi:hypothetical protein